jgi:hypothetical protein
MPLKKGSSRKTIAANMHELRHGPEYAATRKEHGKAVADKQMIAIALEQARKSGANIPEKNE